ncbi:MAG: glycoside hydrolase family 95 protein [Burkholderiales bacterium]|nr:glycoside hydrolase family 95 protein [Opitutaceae bacterium]
MTLPPLLLRYTAPAEHFTSAAMVGNGRLGAVVFGHTHRERMVLNEDSCWAGGPKDRLNPLRADALARVRELLFAGRHEEADTLAREHLLATPRTIDSYQPMGELALRQGWRGPISDYRRWLDLDGAVAGCEWRENGALHRRLVFASAVDQVLVIRHETDAATPPPFAFSLEREGPHSTDTDDHGDLLLLGHADARADRYGSDSANTAPIGQGMPIALRIRRLPGEGKCRVFDGRLEISEARSVTVLVALATGFRATAPSDACRTALDAAARFSADELLARHQADHRALFRRFHLDLGAPADDGRPLPERLAALRAGASDPGLIALVVQHRRYLLLAASRPGSLPSNLQGLWTEQRQGPWNSDYHFNINLQMNYWVAEPTGLGECAEPLLDWAESIVPASERTARELYGCRGWTLHHLSDCWGATEPFDGIWGLWPWGGAWLCLHLHDHWRYSAEPAVLARVWPLLRGAARFALDFLVEGPPGTAHAGLLTTCPSHSPENAFLDAAGRRSKFTYGCTMDLGLCRALFAACIEELDALDTDPALRAEIVAAQLRLPPPAISARTGGIQEWAEDFADADPGHRHVSPLFDLHPGSVISRRHTPELAEAAAASLRRKAAHQADDTYGQPGWTLNWLACLWARLGDGEQAHARLLRLLTHASTPNLWTFAYDQAQAADACGTAAAVCEMLVHDEGQEL